jgi:hypothetical protein
MADNYIAEADINVGYVWDATPNPDHESDHDLRETPGQIGCYYCRIDSTVVPRGQTSDNSIVLPNISKAVGVCITREAWKAFVPAVEHRRGGCTFLGQSADPSYSVIRICELPLGRIGATGSDGVGKIINPVSGDIPPLPKPCIVVPFSGPLAASLGRNVYIIHDDGICKGLKTDS